MTVACLRFPDRGSPDLPLVRRACRTVCCAASQARSLASACAVSRGWWTRRAVACLLAPMAGALSTNDTPLTARALLYIAAPIPFARISGSASSAVDSHRVASGRLRLGRGGDHVQVVRAEGMASNARGQRPRRLARLCRLRARAPHPALSVASAADRPHPLEVSALPRCLVPG